MVKATGMGLGVLLVAATIAIPTEINAQASSGDVLVTDVAAGGGGLGALFTVNPATGSRTILSDFGNANEGPFGNDPRGVTVDASGTILVTDTNMGTLGKGALFTVNPSNGNRTILSDFGDATQGPFGCSQWDVTVDASGTILVTDECAGTLFRGALFTVNPSTGNRAILSDFGDATQGPTGGGANGATVDASGTILVAEFNGGTLGKGALFTVNPSTGARTILSDFGDATQGPTGGGAVLGVTLDAAGTILVTDINAGTLFRGALFTVNPTTGSRTILSDFGNAIQGPTGDDPYDVTVDASGTILVTDANAGTLGKGALFTVNPTTGSRTILSDFGNAIQGPTGGGPGGVAVFTTVTAPPDNFPPDTTITSAVDGKNRPLANGAKTSSTSIRFTFTGTDNVGVNHFECSLDSAAFSACSSPTSYTNLQGGSHVFQVRAVDTSGNVDPTPATFSWFVSSKRSK